MSENPFHIGRRADNEINSLILKKGWASIIAHPDLSHATGSIIVSYHNKIYSSLDLAVYLDAPEDLLRIFRTYSFPTTEFIIRSDASEEKSERIIHTAVKVIEACMNNDIDALVSIIEMIDDWAPAQLKDILTTKIPFDGRDAEGLDAMHFAVMHKNVEIIKFLKDCDIPLSKAATELLKAGPSPRVER